MKRSMVIDLIESCEDIDEFCLCEQYAPESSDILLEYDTSGKYVGLKRAITKSTAYTITQNNITAYVKKISKLKSKKDVDKAYAAELKRMDNAVDEFSETIQKLKNKKRDNEKDYEKENKFTGGDTAPLLIGLGALIAAGVTLTNPIISISLSTASIIASTTSIVKQQDEQVFGDYMYLKWLRSANCKKITNEIKSKIK